MNDQALLLENQICFRLYKTSRAMIRLYQPILEAFDITYPQYLTMLVLWEKESIDFKELSRKLELKTGTLTPILQKLEVAGYLERIKNEKDNRKINVTITEKGKKLKEKALSIPMSISECIGLNIESYTRYVEILDELGALLSQAEKELRG